MEDGDIIKIRTEKASNQKTLGNQISVGSRENQGGKYFSQLQKWRFIALMTRPSWSRLTGRSTGLNKDLKGK